MPYLPLCSIKSNPEIGHRPSTPGFPGEYALFSAFVEEAGAAARGPSTPGQIIGHRDGAVLVREGQSGGADALVALQSMSSPSASSPPMLSLSFSLRSVAATAVPSGSASCCSSTPQSRSSPSPAPTPAASSCRRCRCCEPSSHTAAWICRTSPAPTRPRRSPLASGPGRGSRCTLGR